MIDRSEVIILVFVALPVRHTSSHTNAHEKSFVIPGARQGAFLQVFRIHFRGNLTTVNPFRCLNYFINHTTKPLIFPSHFQRCFDNGPPVLMKASVVFRLGRMTNKRTMTCEMWCQWIRHDNGSYEHDVSFSFGHFTARLSTWRKHEQQQAFWFRIGLQSNSLTGNVLEKILHTN